MGKLRLSVLTVFILSAVIFAGYTVRQKLLLDTTPPVITCETDELTVSVEDGSDALLQGLTAWDDRDGDLTGEIRVASLSRFNAQRQRTVNYVVFDAAGQPGQAQRTLTYTDYTPPRIYLRQALRFASGSQTGSDGLTVLTAAEDCLEGDLTAQVKYSAEDGLYAREIGTHTYTLQVSNSAGDTRSLALPADVVDSADSTERLRAYPLLDEYILYTQKGQPVDILGDVIGVEQNGNQYDLTKPFNGVASYPSALVASGEAPDSAQVLARLRQSVTVTGEPDYTAPGLYTVQVGYRYLSGTGTAAQTVEAETKLYVVVEE